MFQKRKFPVADKFVKKKKRTGLGGKIVGGVGRRIQWVGVDERNGEGRGKTPLGTLEKKVGRFPQKIKSWCGGGGRKLCDWMAVST